jgi:thymidylate synthase (FAD)
MARVPDVELLRITDDPEELVCRAARNDYYPGEMPDESFADVMAHVDGDTVEDQKRNLIKKLMLRGHWGVFEHPQLTLWFRVSRACMAQITRHRHASFDIQSMRYVNFDDLDPEDPSDFAWPDSFTDDEVTAREGGTMTIDAPAEEREELAQEVYERALDAYQGMVDAGVPKEDARMLLPIGTHVNVTMSLNVRAALHVVSMRAAGDAQWEIRSLAEAVEDALTEHLPVTMEVWRKHRSAIKKQRLAP